MFSIPPATAVSSRPSQISLAAVAIAWAPEPQTRLTVIAGTSTGMPPPTAAWRAGFILLPAWMTFPMTTAADLIAADGSALETRSDRRGAKLDGRRVLEGAVVGADRGADRRAEDDVTHAHNQYSQMDLAAGPSAWFARLRRLAVRYERRADIFEASHRLAAGLICLRFVKRWSC